MQRNVENRHSILDDPSIFRQSENSKVPAETVFRVDQNRASSQLSAYDKASTGPSPRRINKLVLQMNTFQESHRQSRMQTSETLKSLEQRIKNAKTLRLTTFGVKEEKGILKAQTTI